MGWLIKLLHSFKWAFQGLVLALRQERNMQVHAGFTVLVISMGVWLGVTVWEKAVLALVVTLVLVTEMINTALEQVVNLCVGEKFHPVAKQAKDIAAGAVLLVAVNAVLVGIMIFLPKLLKLAGR